MRGTVFALAVLLSLSACCPRVVERVRVETEYIDRVRRDSVYLRDSVWLKEYIKDDTVYVDKEVYRYLYKDRLQRDTILREVHDTTRVSVPVEKGLTVLQTIQIRSFWWLVAGLVAALLWIFRKVIF